MNQPSTEVPTRQPAPQSGTAGTNSIKAFQDFGQSVWLDYLRRGLFGSGEFERLIAEDGLRGVTSNPSIFEKAVAASGDDAADVGDVQNVEHAVRERDRLREAVPEGRARNERAEHKHDPWIDHPKARLSAGDDMQTEDEAADESLRKRNGSLALHIVRVKLLPEAFGRRGARAVSVLRCRPGLERRPCSLPQVLASCDRRFRERL